LCPRRVPALTAPNAPGTTRLLFEGIAAQHDSCSDPACYAAKVDAHVKQTVAANRSWYRSAPLTANPPKAAPVVPRNQYVEIRQEKPKNKYQQDAPEYKTCKYTHRGHRCRRQRKGELRKVCANPDCPVHHPKKRQRRANRADAAMKARRKSSAARKRWPRPPGCAF
jgi:ParB family chromosome partitioning protein